MLHLDDARASDNVNGVDSRGAWDDAAMAFGRWVVRAGPRFGAVDTDGPLALPSHALAPRRLHGRREVPVRRVLAVLVVAGCADVDEPDGAIPPSVPEAVDVGDVPADLVIAFSVPVTAGGLPLEVTRARLRGEAFYTLADARQRDWEVDEELRSLVGDGAHTVPAGATFDWPFVLRADRVGEVVGEVVFETAYGDLPVALSAEVPPHDVVVGPAALSFGDVEVGGARVATLTLQNRGAVSVALTSRFDASAFATTEPTPFLLQAGARMNYELVCRPTEPGSLEGAVILAAGADDVAVVALQAQAY